MRIAVVGLGFMGGTHLNAYRRVPGAQVVAVASDDPRVLSGEAAPSAGNLNRPDEKLDLSALRKYARFEDVMADAEVDAVDLCLPTHLHEAATLAALAAGKYVLVEKPMGLDGASCDRMIAAAEKAGRVLMCAQVLRFWGDYQPLVDARRSGRLGAARAALFRRRCAAPAWGQWLKDASKSGGGVFDLLIHDVDMAIHLFGLPEAVSATGYEDLEGGIDLLTAQLHYRDVPSVTIAGGWHHPAAYPFSMEYTASFDKGTFEFSTAGRPLKLYTGDGQEQAVDKPERDGYEAELDYFVSCAAANRQPELCPPRESAAAVKLMRLMLEARRANGDKLQCQF